MKKKIFLGCLLAAVTVMCFGCGIDTLKLVRENMSEVTQVYYYGENEDFAISIAYGQRENEYKVDGKSGDNVDFCLLTLKPTRKSADELKKLTLSVDDNEQELEILLNLNNGAYMLDLEKKLTGQEKISAKFEGQEVALYPISNDFKIDSKKAVEIACKELEAKILEKKKFTNLNGECYLRVIDKRQNGLEETYWCFTIFNTDGKDYSVIISTEDGSILTKSE